ncbi:hypothetical protein EG327_000337, partial [Venturia inaequalis]
MTSPYSITLGGLEVDHITSKSKMPASLVSFEAAGLDQQNLIVRLWSDLTEARPTPNGKRVTPPDEIFGAASPFGVDLGQLRGDASHEDADMWAREDLIWQEKETISVFYAYRTGQRRDSVESKFVETARCNFLQEED